jgi:hypothetical protein
MSTLPHDPPRSPTVQEVDAWLLAAQERRAQLQCHAASPLESDERQEAFTAMSDLLLEAFEEVRVVSESTREWSQGVRGEAVDLRTHAAQLMERGVTLMARLAQYTPPSPEAIQEDESRMLEIFKNGPGRKDESEQ